MHWLVSSPYRISVMHGHGSSKITAHFRVVSKNILYIRKRMMVENDNAPVY